MPFFFDSIAQICIPISKSGWVVLPRGQCYSRKLTISSRLRIRGKSSVKVSGHIRQITMLDETWSTKKWPKCLFYPYVHVRVIVRIRFHVQVYVCVCVRVLVRWCSTDVRGVRVFMSFMYLYISNTFLVFSVSQHHHCSKHLKHSFNIFCATLNLITQLARVYMCCCWIRLLSRWDERKNAYWIKYWTW